MNNRLEEELRRAPEGTREALEAFKLSGDQKQLERFSFGIIERNIDETYHPILQSADDSTRIIDDLGIDSLTMMEIVMTFEDALNIELIDDELKGMTTLGDMKAELLRKLESAKSSP
jgi:3-hydroxyacyl-[acyl-carrier-protein] dehydratase